MKLFFILLLASLITYAETANVGIYVLNVGKFEPQSGSYSVDFYLSYKCGSNCSPNFEFANGRATSVDLIINEPTEKFYRIQANLQDQIDFRNFPFDKHRLTIELEDKTQNIQKLVYKVDEANNGIEPTIQLIGWKLDGWNAKVAEHYYSPYQETYSKYTFSIELERESLSALLKIFAPIIFIMLLNFIVHFLDPHLIANRISLHASFIVAAVMFHVAVGNQLPPLGYLTVADKFMFAAYASLTFSIASAIAIMEFNEEKKEKIAMKIHKVSKILTVAIWLSGLLLVMLTI